MERAAPDPAGAVTLGGALAFARYAVVIGANQGDAAEPALRWAEEDALRVGEVLTELGDVPATNLVILRGADATEVRNTLAALRRRIDAEGGPTEVFVYYSGHADAADLHLGGTRLPLVDLRALVPGRTRVVVVDACRAGSLTRKGAAPATPFTIETRDELATDGLAIITSAAAGEDAQESMTLRGGVFTHHFLAGLEGAADTSGDARVTLPEVYQYAYARTVASTSAAPTVQHPSFKWDLAGQGDLVLTRLDDPARSAWLRVESAGDWLVLDAGGARVVREATLATGGTLALPAGRYRVRLRTPARLSEADVTLVTGKVVAVAPAELVAVPLGQATRRGGPRGPALALELGGGARGPLLDGWPPAPSGSFGVRLDLTALSVRARATVDHAALDGELVDATTTTWGGELGGLKLADLGRFSVGGGVLAGFGYATQAFTTAGEAPARSALLGRVGPVLHAEWSPWDRGLVELDLGLDAVLIPGEDRPEGRVVPHAALGVGVWLR